jgi:hypothetical protein
MNFDNTPDIDLEELERIRQKCLQKRAEGLKWDGTGNLSVSMPLVEINDFKDSCILRGLKYRQVVRDYCKKFTEDTKEISERNAEKQIEFWTQTLKTIQERKKVDGDLVEKTMEKFINEGVMSIENTQTRGRYSQVVDNTNPVEYRQMIGIWNKIPNLLTTKDSPENVKRCMIKFEERLNKIKNKTVRNSAIENLKQMQYRMYPEIYGSDDGQQDQAEINKVKAELEKLSHSTPTKEEKSTIKFAKHSPEEVYGKGN